MSAPIVRSRAALAELVAGWRRAGETIGVVPTKENPATGKLVALSVMEALRGLVTPFKVGT